MTTNRFGIPDREWSAREARLYDFLLEQAKLQRLTSYTELNSVVAQRTGLRPLDFASANERAAMGGLLGAAVDRSTASHGVMISAIVIYLNENDAGPGFYELAHELGYLPKRASAAQRLEFWQSQVAAVHAAYA